jgi:thiamine-monophosphate kinase
LRAVLAALRARGRAFGAELVGGDLACTRGPLSIAVAGVGEWSGSGRPPSRAGARVGDLVFATGPCGGSGLGRHLALRPRVAEARWLVAHGARALMDVSDGLALDLSRLARASRVRIDLAAVPVHADARRAARASGRTAREHALYDGEDHELLVCVPRARVDALLVEAPRRCPTLAYLGAVRAGSGLWLCDLGRARRFESARGRGWVHGR